MALEYYSINAKREIEARTSDQKRHLTFFYIFNFTPHFKLACFARYYIFLQLLDFLQFRRLLILKTPINQLFGDEIMKV